MIAWEVILLVTGFVCLCVSFFIARSSDTSGEDYQDSLSSSAVWTEKEEQMIRNRVAKLLEERQTDLIDKTTEELNHLCNDKIIAIDEFSRPLLEKIENNHQEVVFMYNMLNEKEKEIKKILAESVVKEERKPEGQGIKKEQPVQELSRQTVPTQKQKVPAQRSSVPQAPEQPPVPQKSSAQKSPAQKTSGRQVPVQPVSNEAVSGKAVQKRSGEKPKQTKKAMPDGRSMDVNELIQKMYKEGKSIIEISKALNIGQGEVKLVITLYGGRGR